MKSKKRGKKLAVYAVFIILFAALLLLLIYVIFYLHPKYVEYPDNYVLRVIDGDTFQLAGGQAVRLICVDAPEIGESGYEESKEFLSSLILYKEVRLEKDVSETDSYGRLLRYVYINSSESGEEIFVNKELVKKGHASLWIYGNDTKRCDEIKY
jgi:endonuclease YncB( thermonuclease family)